jgi:hypothetical protein
MFTPLDPNPILIHAVGLLCPLPSINFIVVNNTRLNQRTKKMIESTAKSGTDYQQPIKSRTAQSKQRPCGTVQCGKDSIYP